MGPLESPPVNNFCYWLPESCAKPHTHTQEDSVLPVLVKGEEWAWSRCDCWVRSLNENSTYSTDVTLPSGFAFPAPRGALSVAGLLGDCALTEWLDELVGSFDIFLSSNACDPGQTDSARYTQVTVHHYKSALPKVGYVKNVPWKKKKKTLWSHSFGTHWIHCPLCFTEHISTSKALRSSAMVGVVVGCY